MHRSKITALLQFGLIAFICVGILIIIECLSVPASAIRHFHLEMFRYGTKPSILRVNQGDQVKITFTSRDTAHSFFLQDYNIDAKVSPGDDLIEVRNPFKPADSPEDVRELSFTAGKKGWGSLVSVSRFRCHVFCGPMHGFEQGDLIVRPNFLLMTNLGLMAAIIIYGFMRIFLNHGNSYPPTTVLDLNRFAFIDWCLKTRGILFMFSLPFVCGLVLIIMAGIIGTQVGARNLAVILIWIIWMPVLSFVIIPLGGRLWCMLCPLPLAGEYLQRAMTKIRLPKGFNIKEGFLQIPIFMIMVAVAASLSGSPLGTAAIIIILMLLSILLALIYGGHTFCRTICPAGFFISGFSSMGGLMVHSRCLQVCQNCRDKSCRSGNSRGWPCPFGLCLSNLQDNHACGFCLECFKTCPHDNVALQWTTNPKIKPDDRVLQTTTLLVCAMAYHFLLHSPWPFVRDIVNLVDKPAWPQFFLLVSMLVIFAVLLVPGVFKLTSGPFFKMSIAALIPLSFMLWLAFFTPLIMVNYTFILSTLSDPFGRGWNLFETAGMAWIQLWPGSIPWIQSGLVLLGLVWALKKGQRAWFFQLKDQKKALYGFAPSAMVMVLIAAIMLIYFSYL